MTRGVFPIEPARLFTWVDVDQYLRRLATESAWPSWLHSTSPYWGTLELLVSQGTSAADIDSWLSSVFGTWFEPADRAIRLESDEALEIEVRETSETPSEDTRELRWVDRVAVRDSAKPLPPPAESTFSHGVRICAFHSYKGGVGRTLHCVALARSLADSMEQPGRVVLVDADLDAPGITWMMTAQGDQPGFSFEDFLALLHGSTDGKPTEAVTLAAQYLSTQERDGVLLLPARRDPTRIGPPTIEPAHLATPGRSRHYLTESLAELAHAVGAEIVLVDLRAGASELSAPILLDPRVHRVFVTTASAQAKQGTIHILEEVGRRAPSIRSTDPMVTVLINMVDTVGWKPWLMANTAAELAEAVDKTIGLENSVEEISPTDLDVAAQPLITSFHQNLLALPSSWNAVCDAIDQTGIAGNLSDLRNELMAMPEDTSQSLPDPTELRSMRTAISEFILQHEAKFNPDTFILTDNRETVLMRAIEAGRRSGFVVGPMGSGKTTTFQWICSIGSELRLRRASVEEVRSRPAARGFSAVVPLVAPMELRGASYFHDHWGIIENARDAIIEGLKRTDLETSDWASLWLSVIERASEKLSMSSEVIFALDGLDELFVGAADRGRGALQGLQYLMDRLRFESRPRRPGVLAFIRSDLFAASTDRARRSPSLNSYVWTLRWSQAEIITLVHAICSSAVSSFDWERPFSQSASARRAHFEDISTRDLRLIWGERFGPTSSRAPRSTDWVLAALSNLNQDIQPGDVVRFLQAASSCAAKTDVKSSPDRILSPESMREGLSFAGRARIDSLSGQDPAVSALIHALLEVPEVDKSVPFELETVNMTPRQIRPLIDTGIVYQEHDHYWIPELYRSALGFRVKGRPRIVAVAREQRRSNDVLLR